MSCPHCQHCTAPVRPRRTKSVGLRQLIDKVISAIRSPDPDLPDTAAFEESQRKVTEGLTMLLMEMQAAVDDTCDEFGDVTSRKKLDVRKALQANQDRPKR